MNIFDLRQELIDDYASYVSSFIEVRDQRIHDYVEEKLFLKGLLWPEPLIQMNLSLKRAFRLMISWIEGYCIRLAALFFGAGKILQTLLVSR